MRTHSLIFHQREAIPPRLKFTSRRLKAILKISKVIHLEEIGARLEETEDVFKNVETGEESGVERS